MAEGERAAEAAAQVKVVKFINDLIDSIGKGRERMREAVEKGKSKIIEEYERLAKDDYAKGKATDEGRIIGEAAKIVTGMRSAVEAFHKAIPSASHFQQQFTRAFGNTPGMTDLVSHGGIEAGTLYFEIQLCKDSDKWSIDDSGTSSAWKLVTKQAHPDRIAESLLESLEGGKPWQIDLPKKVMITIEEEVSGPNDYHEGWIFFDNNPDQISFGGFTDTTLTSKAWSLPMVRSRVLDTTKLEGSNG